MFLFIKKVIQLFIIVIKTSNYIYGYYITGVANMNMFKNRINKYNDIKSLNKFQS